MKRLIVALLVGGAVFGTVFAAAAILDVSGGSLQMSTAVSAICDSDGVTLGYNFFDPDDDPSNDNDVVTEAQVGGIDDDCIGDQLTVELFADPDSNGLDNGDPKCDEAEATIVDNGPVDENTLVLDLDDDDPPGAPDDVADVCTIYEVIASFVNIAGQAVWP